MHFLQWRKKLEASISLAMLSGSTFDLTGSGEPVRIPSARVSAKSE
jgi:hypothetical protein